MPYLNDLIKAQLKGGYTKQQIKQFLARKGYPPTAVAQVDKVILSDLLGNKIPKKFSSKPFIWAILLIGAVFVAYLAVPFFSKQLTENIIKEQESDKEITARFNSDFCNSLIPENISTVQVNEYVSTYHINGSKGKNVRWVASERPPAEFSLFEGPQVFFVYSGNEFEGCGYRQEIENKEIINELKDELGLPDSCKGKQMHRSQVPYEFYNRINLYLVESEEKIIRSTIFAIPKFFLPSFLRATICSSGSIPHP
ncbi:hypothetical protein HYV83_02580 [Candidatus Woesearchaeota archaeon]|nr:hypothetical protein [Candidatus Woesearchaeota archaeon]